MFAGAARDGAPHCVVDWYPVFFMRIPLSPYVQRAGVASQDAAVSQPASSSLPNLALFHSSDNPLESPPRWLAQRGVASFRSSHRPGRQMQKWQQWALDRPQENRAEALRRLEGSLDTGILNLADLGLSALPEPLPEGTTSLYADRNQLNRLPDTLPDTLTTLTLSENHLICLPESLPRGLATLEVSRNQLVRLPERLPASLKYLYVCDNRLARLPDPLPRSMRTLVVSNNPLQFLPSTLPPSMSYLAATYNQLTTLPENTLRLPQDTEIDVTNNPLRPFVHNQLMRACREPDYRGPHIYFSMSTGVPEARVRLLREAAAGWLKDDPAAASWCEFENEPHASDFARFLDRLAETLNAGDTDFNASVAVLIKHLGSQPALRGASFAISAGATASCEDRVSLTFNEMKKMQLAFQVETGDYDHRLDELITLGRGMFRLDRLEEIAREKVDQLDFVDEVEVYLAFQVKLRERLDLPVATPDMRFFSVSWVTEQDLIDAETRVKNFEARDFFSYLATSWSPWQAMLKRLDPTWHAAAQERLIDAMSEDFSTRLAARLRSLNLENDPDAERVIGVQVKEEIAREILGECTRVFLTARGLSIEALIT